VLANDRIAQDSAKPSAPHARLVRLGLLPMARAEETCLATRPSVAGTSCLCSRRQPKVGITFEGDFIPMLDKLVDTLAATVGGGDDAQRRRLAIATAVSTLSDYAGEPLFVRRQGRFLEIERLWRK